MAGRRQRIKPQNKEMNSLIDETFHSTNKKDATLAVIIHFNMETISWAICTRHDFLSDTSKICCRTWTNDRASISDCAPLRVLISPDGKHLQELGYDAKTVYENLKANNEHKRYYFFESIVLKLVKAFTEDVDLQLQDENGKRLTALTVFTLLLDFLITDLKRTIHHHHLWVNIQSYVLIVPEMLQVVGAVDFIRKAALEAGINVKVLSVMTEMDAMAVFHQQKLSKSSCNKYIGGRKFMIVNAGGSSTSIVVHESTDVGVVKESTAVKITEGGIDLLKTTFKRFFSDKLDEDVSKSYEEDWPIMTHDFLLKAFSFEPTHSSVVRLNVNPMLQDDLKKIIRLEKEKPEYFISGCKICLPLKSVQKIVKPSVLKIISDIEHELSRTADVDEIIVFGEFTKMKMLKQSIVEKLSRKNIVFYEHETNSALKGAISIGLGLGQLEKIDRAYDTAIVAAIDFGTTYSGWAYSLRSNFEFDRTQAYTKVWDSGSSRTEKTPTCILIGKDGKTLEAFGYEAEDKYQELVENGEHWEFYYFRRFKMLLNKKIGEKLDRQTTLEDVMNRSLPALDVFALSIKFLKDDLLSVFSNKYLGSIRMDDIHWVLTVPAIWTDGAKQFMREAAIKAGIKSKRLSIALEPEAASMYCRSLSIESTLCYTGGVNISSLSIGTQYMILNAGGGTVDIAVHEVDSEDTIREVHAACCGGWGGTTVDEEFERFLISLVKEDVYKKFKLDHTDDWLYIYRDFEARKRAVKTSNSIFKLKLPASLTEAYKNLTGHKLADDVKISKFTSDVKIELDKLSISADKARSWFTGSIEKTVNMVKDIMLENPKISTILMVGGFSESAVLQNAVQSAFDKINVIVPVEASTSIIKGALVYGLLPKVVTERVLKYTYGIESFERFVPGKHPISKRIRTDKGVVCQNIFSKHAEVDQRVKVGEPQAWFIYSPQYKSQKQMSFSVYASESPNPMYSDVDCTQIGNLVIDLDDHDGTLDREVLVAFTFCGTEIVVEAKDKKTGKMSFLALDFLG